MIKLLSCRRGATAVEFAMLLPVFLSLVFGIVVFGSYLAVVHGLQQLAAEAARSSVAGLNSSERSSIATSYVSANIATYPLISPDNVSVTAATSGSDPNVFVVTVKYNASDMFIYSLPFVPRPPSTIIRSAAIPFGGFEEMDMRSHFKNFCGDERGNFAIMSVGLMTLVIGCAALGVDLGSIFADRRRTQSTADLAAIVAASNLTNATNAAKATVVKNSYPANSLISVELGTYTADATISPQARFVTPAAGTANAARVTLNTQTPLYFAKFLTGSNQYTIKTSATATSTALASFAIGSRLLSINNGLLNSILGKLLGTTLSLSVMDYQSLASAKIDAFSFLSAVATRANLTAVTYDGLLSGNLKVGDIIAGMLSAQQAANGASTATTALSSISQAMNGVTTQMKLGSLMDVGPYGGLSAGTQPQAGVTVSLLDLLNATAGIANGTHQIASDLTISLPGIASVSLVATVGERPQGSNWLTIGTQGASVHTAQTRVLLTVKLLGTGSISAVNLPVYVEVASGTATLNAVSCGYPNITTSNVTLGVTPGIVNAWIGNVTMADMNNFTTSPNPPPAALVSLPLITVTGRANAYMGNTAATNVNFSYADIQAQTKKTVTTTNFTSSLTSSLLGNLSLAVNVGPLGLPIPGLGAAVTGIIGGATGSVDQLLASVLQTLGIGLGQADVWVNGVRCDGAVLVN